MMPILAIDSVVGLQTPDVERSRPAWARQFFGQKMRASGGALLGAPLEDYLSIMDEAAVERSLLFAPLAGPAGDPESFRLDPRVVAEAVAQYPERLSGIAGVDPTAGMAGVRALESTIREFGFIGAHAYPQWFNLPPDDRLWYPIYSKCCELDIPIQIQVGNCHMYSPNRKFQSVGRPILLDTVANDFPELRIVAIHIGWPWTDEMIAMAYKHEHVYIGSDAYAPKHWDPNFVRFIDSWGSEKVIFGTDYPVIDPRRARREIAALPIRPTSLQKYLRVNAERIYRLPPPEMPLAELSPADAACPSTSGRTPNGTTESS